MADYIEYTYRANPGEGASLIAQGREYVIDSVVTSLTFTAHLHDALESILQGQEASMDKVAAQLEGVSIRAAAVKRADGLAHLNEQLGSVPTFRMRSSSSALAPAGEGPSMFFEVPEPELPAHIRATHRALQPGGAPAAPVGGVLAGAQREGICYDLSSLDNVGWCMASEEDRQQDAAARQARQVRRPTIQAAGVLSSSFAPLACRALVPAPRCCSPPPLACPLPPSEPRSLSSSARGCAPRRCCCPPTFVSRRACEVRASG